VFGLSSLGTSIASTKSNYLVELDNNTMFFNIKQVLPRPDLGRIELEVRKYKSGTVRCRSCAFYCILHSMYKARPSTCTRSCLVHRAHAFNAALPSVTVHFLVVLTHNDSQKLCVTGHI